MISTPSPYLQQPPLGLQQPFPGQQPGKGGANFPSPDFSISPKDSFAPPSAGPSSPFSPAPLGADSSLGSMTGPSLPGGGAGAPKLPEVTVIGPNPGKNNTNYSLKAIALYGLAILAAVLGIKYAWPKIFKKKPQAPKIG
jgi:hypothetical protein